jgi:hypothetical protein
MYFFKFQQNPQDGEEGTPGYMDPAALTGVMNTFLILQFLLLLYLAYCYITAADG